MARLVSTSFLVLIMLTPLLVSLIIDYRLLAVFAKHLSIADIKMRRSLYVVFVATVEIALMCETSAILDEKVVR